MPAQTATQVCCITFPICLILLRSRGFCCRAVHFSKSFRPFIGCPLPGFAIFFSGLVISLQHLVSIRRAVRASVPPHLTARPRLGRRAVPTCTGSPCACGRFPPFIWPYHFAHFNQKCPFSFGSRSCSYNIIMLFMPFPMLSHPIPLARRLSERIDYSDRYLRFGPMHARSSRLGSACALGVRAFLGSPLCASALRFVHVRITRTKFIMAYMHVKPGHATKRIFSV